MSAAPRWPLAVIAAPAAVAIWSGWVGLGGLCGFGEVQPLPGLMHAHLNTALTLPLGIESYAALALGAWLRPGTSGPARTFARGSALGALALGCLGQVAWHLLAAAHARRAPDLVVVLVACLPVVVLGCAVALLHLLNAASETRKAVPEARAAAPAGFRGTPDVQTPEVRNREPVRPPRPARIPAADRAATIADLVADILLAGIESRTWAPDYGRLMTQTGRSRSWCEKAVRDARQTAAATTPDSVRTEPALALVRGGETG